MATPPRGSPRWPKGGRARRSWFDGVAVPRSLSASAVARYRSITTRQFGGGKADFLPDIESLRERARAQIDKGPVTEAYGADLKRVIEVCNEALATVAFRQRALGNRATVPTVDWTKKST